MKWRGSYTVEAAVIIPVLIWTMAAAMCTGIDLLHEVREEHEEKQPGSSIEIKPNGNSSDVEQNATLFCPNTSIPKELFILNLSSLII